MMRSIAAALGGLSPMAARSTSGPPGVLAGVLADVLAGAAPRCPPVRRGSRLAGTCEAGWWQATPRDEVRRVLLAARRYELAGRMPGRRRGPLGHVGLEVLDLLANLVSHRTGRLEPSLHYLMGRLRRSKDAVVRALASLRAHGFLDWLRRHEKVELVEGPRPIAGPRIRQVSNAYRLSLPARAARMIGSMATARLATKPPLPDDVVQAHEERSAWLAAHRAALPLSELALAEVEDDQLARVLAEMGRAVTARAERATQALRTAQMAETAGLATSSSTPSWREADRPASSSTERESATRSESMSRS